MPRLLFEKTGNAIWISHLDLMRLFQRAFKRAGLPLKHTQGFNPRPSVSIALPLSVGIESACELLDFELDGEPLSSDEIKTRLNQTLIRGVRILDVYEVGEKLKNLTYLKSSLRMEYDNGIPENALAEIRKLFSGNSLIVEKKSKNGVTEQDLIPMIRELEIQEAAPDTLEITVVACCQNPSMNPLQLPAAIGKYLPQYAPAYVICKRMEIYDPTMNVFR